MRLKNLFGMAAMAALVLSGCSSDEVVENFSPENAIEFGTYVGRDAQSRAYVKEVEELAEEGFGVFAYYTHTTPFAQYTDTPNFMKNQLVQGVKTTTGEGEEAETVYSTENWTYTPLKYWPNNKEHMVTFLAYAPYDPNMTIKEGTNSTIEYNIPTTVTEQKDILFVDQNSATEEKYPSTIDVKKQDIESTVHFHFMHALSRIGFDAEVMVDEVNEDKTGESNDGETQKQVELDPATTITINSVKLVGNFYADGDLELKDGTWSDCSLPNKATELTLSSNDSFVNNANIFKSTDDQNNRKLNNDNNYIMIIPQDFTDVSKNGSLKIIVDYDVVTKDSAFDTAAEKGDGEVKVNNVIESDAFTVNFVQGQAYKFTLHLGMTSVKLSATVQGWGNEEDIAVNVPINTTSK